MDVVTAPPPDKLDDKPADRPTDKPADKPVGKAPPPPPPKAPKQPGHGVGMAIFATVVIVLALAGLATVAYVKTH